MKLKSIVTFVLILLISLQAGANRLLITMDATGQANHLKAYGVAFSAIQHGIKVDWLLNYKGGSFAMDADAQMVQICTERGVSFSMIDDGQYAKIVKEVTAPRFNGAIVKLEKAPKIAVYTPSSKMPWDDAVTLALTYAGIPFDKLYANEVLAGDLDKYDWLHLHHEDFTGQYGKFWGAFHDSAWYRRDQKAMEAMAAKNGYKKVSQMQLAVVKKIRDFVGSGGNLFAMCSATETFDIALSAEGTDICDVMFDGDPIAPDAQSKLDYSKCFAFKDFTVSTNPFEYLRSNIDNYSRMVPEELDYFKIISPSAKLDLVPVMLCQNHVKEIEGFMGQTTAFRKGVIKSNVMILGDRTQAAPKVDVYGNGTASSYYPDYEARYIHGEYGKGSWTFLGGHDPEDYRHLVNDPVTDLALHPNSPGYRLILNNVLFPSVKKIEVPTVTMNSTEHKKDAAEQPAPTPMAPGAVKLYADPASNELVVSIAPGKVTQVVIANISGQELINRSFNAEKVSVNIASLASGIYLVTVNGNYIGKMVKD